MDGSAEVHGGGNRLRWENAPLSLRARIEALAGSRVVAAETSVGGFSPGLASALLLENGRRIFAKAASPSTSDATLTLYRRERDVLTLLPDSVPRARLIVAEESGGWLVLLYEHVEGRHPVPSDPADLTAMIGAFEYLSTALDPSPVPLPPFEEGWAGRFDSWQRAATDAPDAIGLDPWIAEHFDDVEEVTHGWREAVRGNALVHGDLRADNMLLAPDGAVTFLDWPEASRGARWLDIVLALPSMAMFRGAPPVTQLADNAILRSVDRRALAAVVGGLSGFFLCASVQPALPALPTIRSFQRAQGLQAALWLRRLL